MEHFVLGEEFNDAAERLAKLQKNMDAGKKKAHQYNKETKVNVNRLSIYIKNQFFNDFKFKKHCLLFRRDNKIEFQYFEDVDLAKRKYEALGKKNNDWTDEIDVFDDPIEGFIFSSMNNECEDELEDYYKDYDNMKKYLPKPVKRCKITNEQRNELKNLLFACDHPKMGLLLERMDFFQAEYLDIVDEVLDMLIDMEIPFDITRDKLITVRDDRDMSWHLVIEINDDFDNELEDEEINELKKQLKEMPEDELKKLLNVENEEDD
jgi:hypothetical protein